MDSHVGWDRVANRALKDGYGVIRVDLQGHARTLNWQFQKNEHPLNAHTNYRTNVTDVVQILKRIKSQFGIRKPYLVGHSYGGGIATAIAAHPFGKNLIASNLTVIAPYVYRIDGFKAESIVYFFGGLPFLNFLRKLIPESIKSHIESVTTDPLIDRFMEKMYRKHFISLLEKRVPLYRRSSIDSYLAQDMRTYRRLKNEREEIIERHVQAAINITKGIRHYDGRETVDQLSPNLSMNIILGKEDKLVPVELEMEFLKALERSGISNRLLELNTGHMVINEAPRATLNFILESINQQSDN